MQTEVARSRSVLVNDFFNGFLYDDSKSHVLRRLKRRQDLI